MNAAVILHVNCSVLHFISIRMIGNKLVVDDATKKSIINKTFNKTCPAEE